MFEYFLHIEICIREKTFVDDCALEIGEILRESKHRK